MYFILERPKWSLVSIVLFLESKFQDTMQNLTANSRSYLTCILDHTRAHGQTHMFTHTDTLRQTQTHSHGQTHSDKHRHTHTNTHRHTHTQTERLKFHTHTIQSKTPEQSCHKKNVTQAILNRQRELKDVKS